MLATYAKRWPTIYSYLIGYHQSILPMSIIKYKMLIEPVVMSHLNRAFSV